MIMSIWLQNLLVLLGVAACLGIIARQGFKTLTLRGRGKLGACCAKGCHAGEEPNASKLAKPSERVHFMPVEMLSRRR